VSVGLCRQETGAGRTEDQPRSKQKAAAAPSRLPPSYALHVVDTYIHDRLCAEGRIEERACRVIIDKGVAVTVARPGIVATLAERELYLTFALQMAPGGTIHILKQALITLNMGWRPLNTWFILFHEQFISCQLMKLSL
jgi:hypothetical protein